MRKLLITILVLMLLCSFAAAYEAPQDFTGMTLDDVMASFMEQFRLTENNFSISYYNTVTGESYDFNEKNFQIAASTYKLPLNMCFYEMEQEGKIDPNETFRWTGMSLSEVHRQSVLHSNNEVSEAMTGYWNNYYIYKENMRKYSSLPVEEIDPSFYLTNTSCTRMMMDTLKYLYVNSERFEELISYMKDAMPGQYFKAGVTEYEIAHKYGAVNEFVNDVAIIYTPQPILLAVYTQGIYGDGICANAARLLTNYTVWQEQQAAKEAEIVELEEPIVEETEETAEPVEEVIAEAEQEAAPEENTREETPQLSEEELAKLEKQRQERKEKLLWLAIGLGSVILLTAIPVVLNRKKV